MEAVTDVLAAFLMLPIDHLNVLVSLGGLGVAALAIYVVLVVVREQKKR